MSVARGRPWGVPAAGRHDRELTGDDRALARTVTPGSPPRLVWFRPSPDADLARAVGLVDGSEPGNIEVALDAMLCDATSAAAPLVATNAIVLGTAPDRSRSTTRRHPITVTIDDRVTWSGRAVGVVVANGQFVHGVDLVPRGHPGDGRLEVQIDALRRGERREMRRRLPTGTHVPHPRIVERSGRHIEITSPDPLRLEVDGHSIRSATTVRVSVLRSAVRILV